MLRYTITPNHVPRTVSPAEPSEVTLMITVANNTAKDIDVRRLSFTIRAGDGVADLTSTDDLPKVRLEAGAGTAWEIFSSGAGQFTAIPNSPVTGVPAGDAVAFILSSVIVNTALGHAVITVTEWGGSETQLEVAKQEPGLSISEFLAQPVQIVPDGTSVLKWRTAGASKCTLNSEPVGLSGTKPVSPTETTVYTLSAEGGGRTIHQQLTVTVTTVRILSFSASPTRLVKGDETTFRWLVAGATSCILEPGDFVLQPTGGGSKALPIDVSDFHTLAAHGYGRSDHRSVPLTVVDAVISSFTAAPQIVPPGGEVTLRWAAAWTSGFRLDPPGQSLERTVSSLAVAPRQPTTYRLTAHGQNPPAREVTVAVGAAIACLGLTAHPGKPDEMVLAWLVECGTAALEVWTGDGPAPGKPGEVPPAGDQVIPLAPGKLTNIRLTGSGGGANPAVSLHVAGPVVQGRAVLSSLQLASPSGITTERSLAAVSWLTSGGTFSGRIRDQFSYKDLSGPAGQAELKLDTRVTAKSLWTGDIYLREASAGDVGDAGDAGDAGEAAAQTPNPGHPAESLAAWAARVMAAGEVGLRWEVS